MGENEVWGRGCTHGTRLAPLLLILLKEQDLPNTTLEYFVLSQAIETNVIILLSLISFPNSFSLATTVSRLRWW